VLYPESVSLHEAAQHLTRAWQLGGGKDAGLAEQVGRIALDEQRYEDAIAPLRAAGQLNGGNPGTRLLLSQALLSAGRVREAERDLSALVQAHPEVAEAWARLGMIAEYEGRFPEAVQHYARAAQLDPDHPVAAGGLQRLMGGR
jgi:cytochrome c-type biogenesis protein CcmH/NrfG